MMRKLTVALLAAAGVFVFGSALADLTVKDGGGTTRTIKNFVCETTKLCNATVLIKSDGTELGTASQPVRTDPTGTTTQPVSASSLPLPTGAATSANQSTTNTSVGATNESAAGSDTATSGLNGLIKRLLQSITTLNGKIDTLNTNVTAAIPAGTNEIGGVNVTKFAGTAAAVNSGNKDAGTQRVVLATDQPALTNPQPVNLNLASAAVVDDPCKTVAATYTPINISASGSAKIITGTSAKKTYICHIHLVTAAANNVALTTGTGTNCATGTAGVVGGTTAASGWNFSANGGISLGDGGSTAMGTATNADDVCLNPSASTQLSGQVKWVQK